MVMMMVLQINRSNFKPKHRIYMFIKIMMQNIQEDFAVGRLYPDLEKMKEVSIKISTKVAEEAYK